MRRHRIIAVMTRHLYLYRRTPARLMDLVYWPFLDLIVWGFMSVYLVRVLRVTSTMMAALLGALILWNVLFRAQQGITIAFLEEVWSKNLINFFGSPLTPGEFVLATMVTSVVNVIGAFAVLATAAQVFYAYNVLMLGWWLVPFGVNLMLAGWALGLMAMSLILRYGNQFGPVAWGVVLFLQPVSCVFYPLAVLPEWLQTVAWWNPPTHVFEGMRHLLLDGTNPMRHLAWATGLSMAYLGAAVGTFLVTFQICRARGLLTRVGD